MAAVESAESRFASVGEDEITALLLDKDSVNTKRATKVSVGVLQLYLHEKGQSTDFVSLPVASVNELLNKFYIEARIHKVESHSYMLWTMPSYQKQPTRRGHNKRSKQTEFLRPRQWNESDKEKPKLNTNLLLLL